MCGCVYMHIRFHVEMKTRLHVECSAYMLHELFQKNTEANCKKLQADKSCNHGAVSSQVRNMAFTHGT